MQCTKWHALVKLTEAPCAQCAVCLKNAAFPLHHCAKCLFTVCAACVDKWTFTSRDHFAIAEMLMDRWPIKVAPQPPPVETRVLREDGELLCAYVKKDAVSREEFDAVYRGKDAAEKVIAVEGMRFYAIRPKPDTVLRSHRYPVLGESRQVGRVNGPRHGHRHAAAAAR